MDKQLAEGGQRGLAFSTEVGCQRYLLLPTLLMTNEDSRTASGCMLRRVAKAKASSEAVQKDLLVPSSWAVKYVLLNHGSWADGTLMALNSLLPRGRSMFRESGTEGSCTLSDWLDSVWGGGVPCWVCAFPKLPSRLPAAARDGSGRSWSGPRRCKADPACTQAGPCGSLVGWSRRPDLRLLGLSSKACPENELGRSH